MTLVLGPPDRTLGVVVERQAAAQGTRPCLAVGALALDYEGVREAAARRAGMLAAAGVSRGDRVAALCGNRAELISLLLGCAWTGAILVPLNTATRGRQLAHVLANAGPRAIVVEAGLVPHLAELELEVPELEHVWTIGDASGAWRGRRLEPLPRPGDPVPREPVRPGDPLAILYTSGTTGPSKGVVCPHAQFYAWGRTVGAMLGLGPSDRLYTCLPLFHTNALNAFVQSLVAGASFAVGTRFSASRFWERLVEADATVTYLLGTMVSILAARDPSPLDRAHRVRIALAPGTAAELKERFERRFGMRLVDGFGMTETNAVIGPRDGEERPGTMGRVMPGYEAKVVDDEDVEVPDGVPGELVMRADEPFAFASGYWRMPEATVEAWRNFWFHSGDRVVRDADGYFRFLDRKKDAIRRRGENISAWEVEQVLLEHPDVGAAAVIPVPAEHGEDEVMACVVPRAGATVAPEALVRFCERRLAYFAIPRYVDVLEELPLTENGKVRKYLLRERGVTATTWDREAAGVVLRR